jgi:hypothetical protein
MDSEDLEISRWEDDGGALDKPDDVPDLPSSGNRVSREVWSVAALCQETKGDAVSVGISLQRFD